MDKRLYCIDALTGVLLWKFETEGRIFSSPTIIDGKIYCGSNDGKLYEIDAQTGIMSGFRQVTERITNKIAHNEKTKRFFLLTFANELYCLEKSPEL